MAVAAIREVPTDLPHATLYLDELFELEELLISEYAKLERPIPVSFEYEIDSKTRITTRKELEEHGGSSSRFVLNVIAADEFRSERRVFVLYWMLNPSFNVPFRLRENAWAIFGKANQIVESKRDRAKTVLGAMPEWLSSLAFVGLGGIGGLLIATGTKQHSLWVISAIPLLCAGFMFYVGLRPNRIHFAYRRKDERARSDARKARFEKFVWLLLGTILGAVATMLVKQVR